MSFRGSAVGPPVFGLGMTSPMLRLIPGRCHRARMYRRIADRSLSTGFTRAGRAFHSVDVAAPNALARPDENVSG